ncbi:hypothetical protein V6N11_051392 [Hibiscus sabdariffa]|uniref:Uncharacterized protein n=1 Tax=Hibiscus sabdariffa TaxID=183260 RepID=A0ABR2U785_9ROSI
MELLLTLEPDAPFIGLGFKLRASWYNRRVNHRPPVTRSNPPRKEKRVTTTRAILEATLAPYRMRRSRMQPIKLNSIYPYIREVKQSERRPSPREGAMASYILNS